MADKFHEIVFTDSVRKAQAHYYGKSQRLEGAEFAEPGYMKFRFASINDLPIKEADRKFRWERNV